MNVYDAGGARIRKTNLLNNISTFYPVAGYEQTGSAVTKHYSFNGVPVAVRDGSGLFFLYQDGVSSNVYVTDAWGSVVMSICTRDCATTLPAQQLPCAHSQPYCPAPSAHDPSRGRHLATLLPHL